MEIVKSDKVSLKQIFKENWNAFRKKHPDLIQWYMAFNIWKVINCRESDGLGFTAFACSVHPDQICYVPNSCKSRFCSVCAKVQIDKWVAAMNRLFPNCPYYHITFTVPSQFRTLLFEKKELLNAVFKAAAQTLLSFCKEQGFLPAITAVMHTFGDDLKRHIHVHCIISTGGLKLSGRQLRYKRRKKNGRIKIKKLNILHKWVEHSYFPYKMLRKRYQALLIKYLKEMINKNIRSDKPDPDLKVFAEPSVMKSFVDDLITQYNKGFFVWVSEKRQMLKPTIAYIGRYARRPPISEVRISGYDGDNVAFTFTDKTTKNGKNLSYKTTWQLKTFEFIKRLIRHIPPHYFNVIRHYGIIASRVKRKYKKITDKLLGRAYGVKKFKNWQQRQTEYHNGQNPMICKVCQSLMEFIVVHRPFRFSTVKKAFKERYA